ncbi:MAG: universal stress protein [Putridiphycobacter sp.]
MNLILVPTDFSKNAKKALVYACELAKDHKAEIVLMNAYQAPTSTANVMINFIDILEEDSKKDLQKASEEIKGEFPNLKFSTYSTYGTLSEAIKKASNTYKIDLIVMGTAGASNIKSKIFGSNTTDAIKRATQPILVIPRESEYKSWNSITFASNIQASKNDCPFEPLKELTSFVDAKLNVLTVVNQKDSVDIDAVEERISAKLDGINHDIYVLENDSVSDGILEFIDANETDLLVMIRKDYGFIEGLLHKSVTKQIALYANKPILLYKSC